MADETPSYYKFYAGTFQAVSSLPKAKAAKLLYAMHVYFFTGVEPADGELPAEAQRMFDMQKSSIASYRRNALNGTKNRKGQSKTGTKVRAKPSTKPSPKADEFLDAFLEGFGDGLPAETQKVGG